MSKIVKLREVQCGPSPDVQHVVANAKARLRRNDIRALAVVYVFSNGSVGTVFAGHRDGFMHQLVSGATHLGARLQDEMER